MSEEIAERLRGILISFEIWRSLKYSKGEIDINESLDLSAIILQLRDVVKDLEERHRGE